MTEATKKARKRIPFGPFSNELLDQLLAQVSGKDAESLLGESGLIGQLKKQLAERMLAAELTHYLANEEPDEGAGNHRIVRQTMRQLGDEISRGGCDEMRRRIRHCNPHFNTLLYQQTSQLRRLVGRDAAGDPEHDAFCRGCIHSGAHLSKKVRDIARSAA